MQLKKLLKWVGRAVAAPVVAVAMAAGALYLPPVQNYVKDKVADYLSEQTGMDVSIDRVRLTFPLNLAVDNVLATEKGDTILSAESLRMGVKFWPLLKKKVSLSELSLKNVQMDTKGHISDTRIKGRVGELSVEDPTVADLNGEVLDVSQIKLKDSDVQVLLSDTAKEDTTQSDPVKWKVKVGKAKIENTKFYMQTPGDSMRVAADVKKAEAKDVYVDLDKPEYRAGQLEVKDSQVKYDLPHEPKAREGLDPNHLDVKHLNLKAKDVSYDKGKVNADIKEISLEEKNSGLKVDRLGGKVNLDDDGVSVPSMSLHTPSSNLDVSVKMPWEALKNGNTSQMDAKVKGYIGRDDVMKFAGESAKDMAPYYPDERLNVDAHVSGNMDYMNVHRLKASLGQYATLDANGYVGNVTSPSRYGQLKYQLKTGNLSPILNKALSADVRKTVSVPKNMLMGGSLGFRGDEYNTNSTLHVGKGTLAVNGNVNTATEQYKADLKARNFPVKSFLPTQPVSPLTATMHAEGKGFDFANKKTRLKASGNIQSLTYDGMPLNNVRFDALMKDGKATARVQSANKMLNGDLDLTADVMKDGLCMRVKGHVDDVDLHYFLESADSVHLMSDMDAEVCISDDGKRIAARGDLQNINLMSPTMGYPADDVKFSFNTTPDTTVARVNSGDLTLHLKSGEGLDKIGNMFGKLIDRAMEQVKDAHLDQQELSTLMPNVNLFISAGKNNPVSSLLHFAGYDMDSLMVDMNMVTGRGLQGDARLLAFRTGALLLEESNLHVYQDTTGLQLRVQVENTNRKNPNRFKASFNGQVLSNGISLETLFKDERGVEGLNIGLKALMAENGDLTLKLFPETSIIAYRKFKVNNDNYFTLGKDKHISADIDLLADDRTGLKITTPEGDSTRDVTVSLARLNLGELSSVVPVMPKLDGLLGGDVHVKWDNDMMSAVAALDVEGFGYEGMPMGDLGAEVVYLPKNENDHYLAATVNNHNAEVLNLFGDYYSEGDGRVEAEVNLLDFPAAMLNGFLSDDGTVALAGKLNGQLNVTGPASAILIDGQVKPDSFHILSPLYGVDLNVEGKPVDIVGSKLHMEGHNMYSKSSTNPLVVSGDVDFSNLDAITLDMAFKAKNFEVVNSPRTKETVLFGNVYADIDATLKGTTDFMILRGKLKVLGNTNMTYVMKDSPLTVEDRLNGLVEFVDFSDTTTTEKETLAPPSGMLMVLNVNVSDQAKMHCELSADGSSYFDCQGGGNLDLKYFPSGEMTLVGRFTMYQGEMKYALPFIPLKTFVLNEGSYISFTGDPYNPGLHITAMETTRASVNDGGGATRMVTFNVGVAISQTLNDMGLEFLIDAPEDMNVQNELASMSKEERGKLALSMLATGMYLTSTNKSSFQANNALNAFLQSEIQNIAGNALKTIDVTVGVEGSTSATGDAQTDYSFQFAKRLWNDRVTFKIGGKVTTGSANSNENQSFIDNVSLEYRLGKAGLRHLRVFYDHDNVDPLEGVYSTAGAGLVLRKKTDNFGDLFIFRKHKDKAANAVQPKE